jgi:hypothetical protein
MQTCENFNKFISEYSKQLTLAVSNYPNEYCYPVSQVPSIVEKMKVAFIRKSFNKDSRAIKATCKVLKIGYTYRDIETYLGYNEI